MNAPVAQLSEEAISVEQLRFRYGRGPVILDIARWQVPRGGRVFLRGPSGSGKSTLLNLLSGTLVAPRAQLRVLGQSLAALGGRGRDRFRARHIGVVFQHFNLIPYLSVLDNLRLAAHFGGGSGSGRDLRSRAIALLAQMHLPDNVLERRAEVLSVGQQQRVAIARALINQPQLLFVDEPTSALDRDARDAFVQLLMQSFSDAKSTLVFVSHDIALAEHFPLVADMRELNQVWRQEVANVT